MKKLFAILAALTLTFVSVVGVSAMASADEACAATPGEPAWDETVVITEPWDEVIVTEAAHWQRYSWTGGPHESDDPPAFPSDDWQANVQGDPHNIGVAGPYFRSHGNSGNGDWFYLEWVAEVTSTIHHEAVTEIVHHDEVLPVTCEPDPTPSETFTPSPEPTETMSPSPTPTETKTPCPEPTETVTSTPEPTATPTDQPTPEVTPSPDPTVDPEPTVTPEPTAPTEPDDGETTAPEPSPEPSPEVTLGTPPLEEPVPSPERLAATGVDLGVWVVIGIALIAAGVTTVTVRRK